MKFINGKVYSKNFKFESLSFEVLEGKFFKVGKDEKTNDNIIDLKGKLVLPGLVDIHTHGAIGYDFTESNEKEIHEAAKYYAKNGITSFLATSLTLPKETLIKAYSIINEYHSKKLESSEARLVGINMEGPFFSKEKKGSQNEAFIIEPNIDFYNECNDASGDLIKIVCVAPEIQHAMDFIKEVSKKKVVSVAHTSCGYEDAKNAIMNGANHLTHTFNAMNGIKHREPGPIPAFAETKDTFIELICDGMHVVPPMIKFIFDVFGSDRVCIISDSLRQMGLPDGEYTLGGLKTVVDNGVCKLLDGTIAGAITCSFEGMRRAIRAGVDKEIAIKAATYNPAKSIGLDKTIGSIEDGKFADFVITDDNLNIETVYVNGIKV